MIIRFHPGPFSIELAAGARQLDPWPQRILATDRAAHVLGTPARTPAA